MDINRWQYNVTSIDAMLSTSITHFFFAENGKLYAQIHIGLTEKTIVATSDGLGDDLWHSLKLERRGMVVTLGIDDDRPLIGIIYPPLSPIL